MFHFLSKAICVLLCCKKVRMSFSPIQLQLPQSISSEQLKRLQSAELRAGQPLDQRLQVSALNNTATLKTPLKQSHHLQKLQ